MIFNKSAFSNKESLNSLVKKIDELNKSRKDLHPLIAHRNLESFKTEHVYNSGAIEGNTLTLGETHIVPCKVQNWYKTRDKKMV